MRVDQKHTSQVSLLLPFVTKLCPNAVGSNDLKTNPSGCYDPATMRQTVGWYVVAPLLEAVLARSMMDGCDVISVATESMVGRRVDSRHDGRARVLRIEAHQCLACSLPSVHSAMCGRVHGQIASNASTSIIPL
jgi:hypothetical protein